MATEQYCLENVVRSHAWLGHQGWTELNAFHPEYRPGHYEWNVEHRAFPRVGYASSADGVASFVRKHSSRLVCYSLNPRPEPYKNQKGYPRAAREEEVAVSQNLLFDVDFEDGRLWERLVPLHAILVKADEYFLDNGFRRPAKAFTGGGFHLLFAYRAIEVSDHPDVKRRLEAFREEFQSEFRRDLSRLEAKLDHTQDLRRMVRIYGTAKPDVGIQSRFYGGERREDDALRDHILSLNPIRRSAPPELNPGELPSWFPDLLHKDRKLRRLWRGEGKPSSLDVTRSGYDFSLVRRLLKLGHADFNELAAILYRRPDGGVRGSGKGERYVRRTIANAIRGDS